MTTLHLWREFSAVFPAVLTLELGRYVVAVGLVSVLIRTFWRAGLKTRKIQARSASWQDYRREVLASLRTVLIFTATGFSMHLAAKAGGLTIYHSFWVRGPVYFALSLAAMVIAHDAYFYWTHRAMHHPRLFRWFHRTHHKSHAPTPWTAYAFDAPEAIVMVAFVPLWVAVVPMHQLAIYIFMTWQIARNVLGHAGVELSPVSGKPSCLFGWLNTTTHHDLHHQNARFNYGLYFSWWDRLMGTEHPDYQARVAEIVHCSIRRTKLSPSAKAAAALLLAFCLAQLMMGEVRGQGNGIAGNWTTKGFGSIVQFRPCTATPQIMCGRIIWLWEPNSADGRARLDEHNPDPALRTRSLIGIEIVRGLRQSKPGIWTEGEHYNPDDGQTYTGTIRLGGGMLELSGCAISIFCDTQFWRRQDDVAAAVRGL
jgi:Delta7-sterol 5-desaturase